MLKKIGFAAAAVAVLVLGVLIWRLDFPHWTRLDLNKIYAQPQSTTVIDAAGNVVGTPSSASNHTWTSLSEIPKIVQNAFLAAEDHRFYEHCGLSVRRIFSAALTNLRSGGYAQGASTITQQLVKLTHLSSAKTLSRKAQEAWLALQLERTLSKDEILECYLNAVYFGKGAYGVAAAAKTYFDKSPADLNLSESALLAGIIKAPSSYAPHLNAEKSVQRRDDVLSAMAKYGYITDAQAQRAQSEPLQLALQNNETQYGWFLDAALSEASDLLTLSADDVLSAGYTLETAFDPALQNAADALFEDESNFPPSASDGTPVQAAFVAMNPENGAVRAMIGGREYEVRRGLNHAVQIRRSPGSTLKPVSTYAAAIDAYGFSPSSLVEDTPREFDGGYTPQNAGGHAYGTVTLREALSRSLNIATVDLADLIGVSAVRSYAQRFGLSLAWQDENLSLALGAMTYGVSPAELCAAYAALANGGTQVKSHLIERILDANGRVVYEAAPTNVRAVQESTAYMLTDMLKTAASSGSAKALSAAGMPVAAKTGTVSDADGSTRDVWTAAYTPDLALTVWMGFDAPDSEHQLAASEGGSGYPARLCAAFLTSVSDCLSKADFQRPAAVRTLLLDKLALEHDDILLATERTPQEYTVAELFHTDSLPSEFSKEWTAPESVGDLKLISKSGETPVIEFTACSDIAEYLVLRACDGETQTIAALTGQSGETLRFADTEADLTRRAQYSILPRHRLLYERGELLTGKESAAVTYSPGGLLDWFLPSDPSGSTPEPAEIELQDALSIFG